MAGHRAGEPSAIGRTSNAPAPLHLRDPPRVESAEGWRAGFENMDGEGELERTMWLAEKMNARRSA